MAKKTIGDLNEREQEILCEMIDAYKIGKKMFWVVIAIGMFATAIMSIIKLFGGFKG